MANMSNYLENKLIDHLFRNTSYTVPATISIALVTTAATDTSVGSSLVEVTGGSYGRVTVTPSTANWRGTDAQVTAVSAGTGGTTDNAAAITFTTATADWGTVVGVAITDGGATAAGNVLFYGTLTANKVVSNGDTFQFAANQLTVQIDN